MTLYSAKHFTKFGYYGATIYLDWTLTVILKTAKPVEYLTITFTNTVC